MEKVDDVKVVIKGVDIPFWDLLVLLVKLAFASIPAMFVVYFVLMLFTFLFGGFFDLLFMQG